VKDEIGYQTAISQVVKGDHGMKTLRIVLFGLTLFVGTVSAVYADCQKDGKTYSEGTVISGFKCVNGRWVRA
jgi:hypothetical protein